MTTVTTETPRSSGALKARLPGLIHSIGPALILLALLIFASWMSDVFLTQRNMFNVLRQVAGIGLMSVGMLFVILTRGIALIASNAEAVRLSGISISRYEVAVYAISGGLAAVAGVVSASRTGIGSATISVDAKLDAIAAVVIGGASPLGGSGGAISTFIGVVILGVISNLMNLANVPGYHQQVFKGAIIIGAMLLQYGTSALKR